MHTGNKLIVPSTPSVERASAPPLASLVHQPRTNALYVVYNAYFNDFIF